MGTQDGTEQKQDVTTSGTATGTSMFTSEQVAEQVRKAKSDALADVGRLRTSADNAVKAAQAAEGRITQMLKEQEERELEAVKDNPDGISAIRERQKRRQLESELTTARTELNDKSEKLKGYEASESKSTQERKAREIASRLGVDAERLLGIVKFTDGSAEAIEEIAKELPKIGVKPPLKSDSGGGSGSAGSPARGVDKMRKGFDTLHPQG